MTDSSSFHGSSDLNSTSSGDLNSHTMSKIRTIRLNRPHTGNKNNLTFGHPPYGVFGFSIRGGREYSTGFFVSHVIPGSEADLKGLQVGDQIIRVGGVTGNYRVDDAVHKELSQFISNQNRLLLKVRAVGIIPIKESSLQSLTWHVVSLNSNSSLVFDHNDTTQKDVRILLNLQQPRTKLGCGICKGPDWKPGIYVQFTKENGIARESGLRTGDQILSCNGIDFSDIPFSEAVSILKSNSKLELYVRTCVGLDLFPGSESSGYNSSASSITGDQSPCWGEATKRLSIVREESTSSTDRIRRKEKIPIPKITKQNTTIIKLSENGPTMINNTLVQNKKINMNNNVSEEITKQDSLENQEKIANICFVSRQKETKVISVDVEVHHLDSETPQFSNLNNHQDNRSSNQSTLSNAISEELRRRAEKKLQKTTEKPFRSEASEKPNPQKVDHHSNLMDEFKKAHQKMFKSQRFEGDTDIERKSDERQLEKQISQKVSQDKRETTTMQDARRNLNEFPVKKKAPPPPPPMKKIEKETIEPVNFTEPVPDYDEIDNSLKVRSERTSGTLGRVAIQESLKANGENAEMDSIKSFRLNPKTPPAPPPMYFSPLKPIPSTMKKVQKPISVIINHYDEKKSPGKFNFLETNCNGSQPCDEDMTTRLKKELEKTLSRSNLKKRSDSMDDLINSDEILKSTQDIQKSETSSLNGILKNGSKDKNNSCVTKNISFGEIKP